MLVLYTTLNFFFQIFTDVAILYGKQIFFLSFAQYGMSHLYEWNREIKATNKDFNCILFSNLFIISSYQL